MSRKKHVVELSEDEREELERFTSKGTHRAEDINRAKILLKADDGLTIDTERAVLATGFTDGRPDPPAPRTARGLHYCLHCDAYMLVDARKHEVVVRVIVS